MPRTKKNGKKTATSIDDLGCLVVSSKIKKAAKITDADIRFGKDARDQLSSIVGQVIEQSVEEAKNADMGTVKERHVDAAVRKIFAIGG